MARILAPFVGGAIDEATLTRLSRETYAGFAHAAVAPLVQLEHRIFALELFHGPTLSFKDFALQLIGRLFDHVLAARGEQVTIVGATSGDTGSAAIERDRENTRAGQQDRDKAVGVAGDVPVEHGVPSFP